MNSTGWQPFDAWVLSALPRYRGKDLSVVIGNIDALNHDIIPRDELEATLRRLGGAGFVKLGARISLTRSGRELVSRGVGGGMIEFAQSLEPVIAAEPTPSTLADWGIDQSEYESAYERYKKRMRFVT